MTRSAVLTCVLLFGLTAVAIPVGDSQSPTEPGKSGSEVLSEPLVARAEQLRERALASEGAYEFLEELTSEIGARFSGSEHDPRAGEWALRKLTELGFQNVHAEEVVVPCWQRGEAAAEITAPERESLPPLALGGSVGTPPEGIEAEVLEVGGLEELARRNREEVEGKIVFLNQRMPRRRDGAAYGIVSPIRRAGPAAAGARGAVAVLIRSVSPSTTDDPHAGMTHYEEGVPKIPAASLSNRAADRLEARLRGEEAVRVRLRLGCRYLADVKSANVIGEIPGRERPEEIVLLAAHLDSWDVGTRALDDGAGCAIITEVARLIGAMEPGPRRTIRVLFATNEEFGLLGALAYRERHEGERERHVLGLESDFGADRVWRMASRVALSKVPVIRDLGRLLEPLGVTYAGNQAFGGADLLPLIRHRVPVLEMRHDATRYFDAYHSVHDTIERVDRENLAQCVAVYALAALVAAEYDKGFGRSMPFRGELPYPLDRLYEGKPMYR